MFSSYVAIIGYPLDYLIFIASLKTYFDNLYVYEICCNCVCSHTYASSCISVSLLCYVCSVLLLGYNNDWISVYYLCIADVQVVSY